LTLHFTAVLTGADAQPILQCEMNVMPPALGMAVAYTILLTGLDAIVSDGVVFPKSASVNGASSV
jgi:hypothetical protein